MKTIEYLNKEEPCPECGIHAPTRQIKNLGMCERCSLTGKIKTKTGETLNPEHNIIDKWKYRTPQPQIHSEGAI